MGSRWKSYRLWVAIFALVGMLLKNFGLMNFVEDYQSYVDTLLSILVFSGIIHSPDTSYKKIEYNKEEIIPIEEEIEKIEE